MSRHVTDTQYLGHELSVYEESRTNHSVDVKDSEGITLAGYTGLTDDGDAIMVGKAYVDGKLRAEAKQRDNVPVLYPGKTRPVRASDPATVVRVKDLIADAGSLLSDGDGDNTEYDRALVELIGRIVGIPLDLEESRAAVLAMLRAVG